MEHDLEAASYHVRNCIPARTSWDAPRLGSRPYTFGRPAVPESLAKKRGMMREAASETIEQIDALVAELLA
jgi:hypothetical protein